jgi:hypothetical protein
MAFQNLLLPIVSVFRSAGIQAGRTAVSALGKDFDAFAREAGKASMAFAGLQALMSSTQFIQQSVDLTQRFERNMLALDAVFEQVTPRMARFTETAFEFGVSQSQAAQASVFLGSVLKQYGLDVGRSADETQRLVILAQDLATTYGYDLSESLVAITALFRGEYDPIEKFGVAMKQSEVNSYLAARGLDKLEGSARFLEEVQARLTLLYERSADAQGAFTRATDTLYAAQSKLAAGFENLMIAFGTPLQEPLANIIDQMAELALDLTPTFVAIADTLAKSLEVVGPLFVSIVELLSKLLILLVPVIATVAGLANILSLVITPLAKFVSYLVDLSSGILAGAGEDLAEIDWAIGNLIEDLDPEFQKAWEDFWNAPSMFQYEGSTLERLINLLVDFSYWVQGNTRDTFDYNSEQKRFELQAERSAEALVGLKDAAEETTPALSYMQKELETLGIYATSAEGNLIGLAGIFEDIDTAAKKSEASKALDDIGFSAGQIETILTKPDWYQIFADIAAAAAIATQDISAAVTSGNFALVNEIMKAQGILEQAKNEITSNTTSGGAPDKPRDAVKALFNQIRDEVNKQAAATKLAAMGASKGLIQLILGDKDWAKLWQQIKTGTISLKDLQKQFNNTAAGVAELEDALQAARDQAQDYIDKQQAEADRLRGIWEDAKAAALDFKKTIAEISSIEILPTIGREVGKFEQQILSFIDSIRDALKQGFDSGTIFEEDYKALQAYANKEAELLQSIARQRDDLANRYALSEALIKEYKSAFTSAASLTSLFSKLKAETEKRTVTEITSSVAQLSGSLKQFNVTVTREYEETIDKVINKSEGLIDGFRDMATKARSFAENLRRLKEMGLNGDLFNQLVEAGVEAGGETAQALVDGGSGTIGEINSLFDEINQLGSDLGEDVAATMYGTGIDMADGLLAGIQSKQSELEILARSMADAFNKEFQLRVSTATDKPVAAAEAAFNDVTVPKLEDIDIAGLAQLNAYLENAGKALGVVTGSGSRTGIENKIDIVEMLRNAVLGGAKLDLSGIVSGLTTSELKARADAAMGVTNNITVNVATDATQSNAMVGQTIANVINNYTGKGGTLLSGVAL